jgi:transcriptional regulator with XRE-family HTH domain
MNDLRKRFGRLVAAHRRQRGLTQQKLAEACELGPDMIARIESGSTGASFPSISRISLALDVDPGELFLPEGNGFRPVRSPLADVISRLSSLSDRDLKWVDDLLAAALKSRP